MTYYVYDGTTEGFLTAVFCAYNNSYAYIVRSANDLQLAFDDCTMPVISDKNKAERVSAKLKTYDKWAFHEIETVLRGDGQDCAQTAYLYLRCIMRWHAPVRQRLAEKEVLNFCNLLHKIRTEIHRMKGFLRFMETESGVLYAPYAPDNDITDFLLTHFAKRFGNIKFMIHDTRHGIAGLYNGKDTLTVPLKKSEICLSDSEENFCRLWKEYYAAVNIPERKRLKQMKGYMPTRYWKFLTEKK